MIAVIVCSRVGTRLTPTIPVATLSSPCASRVGSPVARNRIPTTMGNAGALEAARLIRPRTIIPIHLGLEPRVAALRRAETAESFRILARNERLTAAVVSLEPGESYCW